MAYSMLLEHQHFRIYVETTLLAILMIIGHDNDDGDSSAWVRGFKQYNARAQLAFPASIK